MMYRFEDPHFLFLISRPRSLTQRPRGDRLRGGVALDYPSLRCGEGRLTRAYVDIPRAAIRQTASTRSFRTAYIWS